MRRCILVTVSILALLSLQTACGSDSDTGTEPAAHSIIDAMRAHLVSSHERGDADAIVSVFQKGGRLDLPGEPALEGSAAIEGRYVRLFAEFQVSLALRPDESRILNGSQVLEEGTFDMTWAGGEAGARFDFRGAYRLEGSLGPGGLRLSLLQFEVF